MVGRWTCNPEVPGSNPTPCHWMDLSWVAPNSNSPRCVNSKLVSLPPVGILKDPVLPIEHCKKRSLGSHFCDVENSEAFVCGQNITL